MDWSGADFNPAAQLRAEPFLIPVGLVEDAAGMRGLDLVPPPDTDALSAIRAAAGAAEPWPDDEVSLHDLLRTCIGMGWNFEPVVSPLFKSIYPEVVSRHGGDRNWLALTVTLSEDRQVVKAVRWAGGGEVIDPPRRMRMPSEDAPECDWVLLFVRPEPPKSNAS